MSSYWYNGSKWVDNDENAMYWPNYNWIFGKRNRNQQFWLINGKYIERDQLKWAHLQLLLAYLKSRAFVGQHPLNKSEVMSLLWIVDNAVCNIWLWQLMVCVVWHYINGITMQLFNIKLTADLTQKPFAKTQNILLSNFETRVPPFAAVLSDCRLWITGCIWYSV